jgi:glycosyltransferase involved in cell wall biosynthesis
MKKICHLCSAHPALDSRVFRRACVTLAGAGYETHLIAVSEERHTYFQENVIVHPVQRIDDSMKRIRRRYTIAKMAQELHPDMYHVHEPELLRPVLKIAGTTPVIFDIHEAMWITLMERDWIPRLIRPIAARLWDMCEQRLIQRCAALVPATDEVAEHYRCHHNKVITIRNYPDKNELHHYPAGIRDGTTCIYAGTLAPNRGIVEAIEAIALLKKRGLCVPLAVAGVASDRFMATLQNLVRSLGVQDLVVLHGNVPRPKVLEMINNASIGLIPHHPMNAQIRVSIPVKLLEYMALGLPVLYSNAPNHMIFVQSEPVGIGVDDVTPQSLADGIQWLIDHRSEAEEMGRNGRRSIAEKFNWEVESVKLVGLYDDILHAV